jgi:hypothetical protein
MRETRAIGQIRLPRQLLRLDEMARSLTQSNSLEDVKAFHDQVDAVKHYARSARAGLQVRNQLAEWILRAERQAGKLIPTLVPHGGNRKSSSHMRTLKLEDLGIDKHQSVRWQELAKIPDDVFELYIDTCNRLKREISAPGLLRFAKQTERGRHPQRNVRPSDDDDCIRTKSARRSSAGVDDVPCESIREMVAELKNGRNTIATILKPLCEGPVMALELSQRRYVLRLLEDFKTLIEQLDAELLSRKLS